METTIPEELQKAIPSDDWTDPSDGIRHLYYQMMRRLVMRFRDAGIRQRMGELIDNGDETIGREVEEVQYTTCLSANEIGGEGSSKHLYIFGTPSGNYLLQFTRWNHERDEREVYWVIADADENTALQQGLKHWRRGRS